jgi:hypothetical protein
MTKRRCSICLAIGVAILLVASLGSACSSINSIIYPTCIGVRATLNGIPWTGGVNYKLTASGQTDINGDVVGHDFCHVAATTWTCTYANDGSGPAGATFVRVTPSSQEVVEGNRFIFILEFSQP